MESERSAFSLCLNILEFYGIHQTKSSKASRARGIVMFIFIVLQFLIASLYRFSFARDLNEFIISVIYIIFSVILTIKLMSFVRNQNNIIQLIKEIEALDIGMNAHESSQSYRR